MGKGIVRKDANDDAGKRCIRLALYIPVVFLFVLDNIAWISLRLAIHIAKNGHDTSALWLHKPIPIPIAKDCPTLSPHQRCSTPIIGSAHLFLHTRKTSSYSSSSSITPSKFPNNLPQSVRIIPFTCRLDEEARWLWDDKGLEAQAATSWVTAALASALMWLDSCFARVRAG